MKNRDQLLQIIETVILSNLGIIVIGCEASIDQTISTDGASAVVMTDSGGYGGESGGNVAIGGSGGSFTPVTTGGTGIDAAGTTTGGSPIDSAVTVFDAGRNDGNVEITGGTSGAAAAGSGAVRPNPGNLCLQQGSGDYSAAGPYQVTQRDVDLGGNLGPYTVFYPENLEASCPHPIAAWGNGTGVSGSGGYAFYHTNAASWGIVVIASHNTNAASQPFLAGGIDWLLAQNEDPSSEFYHKLSTRAGVSGHSQGAMAATSATQHSNVEALVQVQGGGLVKAGVAALLLSGTADDIVGTEMPTMTYQRATGPACLAIYEGADHISTPTMGGWFQRNPGTVQYVRLYTAWYRCFLADDETACAIFKGNPPPLASEPGWATLETKNI